MRHGVGSECGRPSNCGRNALRGLLLLGVLASFFVSAAPADAANYVVYFHGRSMKAWPSYGLVHAPGWGHITSTYNGSELLSNSTARGQVKSMLTTYCRGGNSCVALCFSAGCNRLLIGIDDANKAGTPPTTLLWTEAIASATGGTEAAQYTSKWWKKFLAKVYGYYAKIDKDLHPSVMRSNYGYVQNVSPTSMYHRAGSKDICLKFLFGLIKICGNKTMPSKKGDGAVPYHSACGYAAAAGRTTCCDAGVAKYTNRQAGQCAAYGYDHAGMFAVGIVAATVRTGNTKSLASTNFPDNTGGRSDCVATTDDCDTWVSSTEKTLPGILNITPADTDKDGKPDNCIEIDRNSCGRCWEYSVAEMAYASTCNIYMGTRTMSTYQTSFIGTSWAKTSGATRIRFTKLTGESLYMDLTNGVTVALSQSGYELEGDITSIATSGTNKLVVNWSGYDPDRDRDTTTQQTYTFTGATVVRGRVLTTSGSFSGGGPPEGVRFEGNTLWFRHCRTWNDSSGYCMSYYEKQFIILHPNDTGNDGS